MSAIATAWALDLEIPSTHKLILVVLADHAGPEHDCWPAHASVARRASTSARTVQRSVRWLEANGLVTVTSRNRGSGAQTSNLYRLAVGRPVGTEAPLKPVENPVDAQCMGGDTLSPGGGDTLSGGGVTDSLPNRESFTLNQREINHALEYPRVGRPAPAPAAAPAAVADRSTKENPAAVAKRINRAKRTLEKLYRPRDRNDAPSGKWITVCGELDDQQIANGIARCAWRKSPIMPSPDTFRAICLEAPCRPSGPPGITRDRAGNTAETAAEAARKVAETFERYGIDPVTGRRRAVGV